MNGKPPLWSVVMDAARKLHLAGQRAFTLENLLVEAWRLNKAALGLRGFEEDFPDSNKLKVALYKRKGGLLSSGKLVRVGAMSFGLGEAEQRALFENKPEVA